jgi:serine/threonine-protein kinase
MKICPMCGASYEDESVFCSVDGAALRSLADGNDLIHTVIADRYLITRKLGEGGMGRVYLAKHVRLPRSWAIKILDPALVRDTGSLARFNQEAASASRIENRHVARVIDFGETADGLLYLAMEYVDGEPLSKIIEREGPLDPARVVDIASQVAEALGAAHELGIVHRDLKPDNIMVGRGRDGSDEVKVVDFGIAKAMHDEREKVTKTGFVIGTPEYMSPEQISAGEVDGRSDVYALALVTFRMLTGRLPFPADTPQEAMVRRVTHPPRTLADMYPDPDWPAQVQGVLDRGLAREPDDRFPTAADFANALRAAVDGWRSPAPAPSRATPAPTHRPPANADAPRAARRSPALVRVAAALGIVAVLGVGGYYAFGTGNTGEPAGDSLAASTEPGGVGLQVGTAATAGDSVASPVAADSAATQLAVDDAGTTTASGASSASSTPTGAESGANGANDANDATAGGAPPRRRPDPAPTTATRGTGASGDAANPVGAEDASARAQRARHELDGLEAIIEELSKANAHRLLASVPDVLPWLATRRDTVEAWYYALQANILLNDIPAACGIMQRIGSDGKSTPFAAPLQVFSDSLPCR